MSRPLNLAILLISTLGCSATQVRDSNDKWADGVVVANNMCAQNRSVQHSNDRTGKRAWCQLEELVGSHLPKCVCRDEQNDDRIRNEAQQYLREAEQVRYPIHD